MWNTLQKIDADLIYFFMAYKKTESFDQKVTEQLQKVYQQSLALLGEDVQREGLLKTPERMVRARRRGT